LMRKSYSLFIRCFSQVISILLIGFAQRENYIFAIY